MAKLTNSVSIIFILADGTHRNFNTKTVNVRACTQKCFEQARREFSSPVVRAAVAVDDDVQIYTQSECVELAGG